MIAEVAMFNSQQVLRPGKEVRVLVVRANGGQLLVEKRVGPNWITADTFAADGAHAMQFGCGDVRFTPSSGAEYELE